MRLGCLPLYAAGTQIAQVWGASAPPSVRDAAQRGSARAEERAQCTDKCCLPALGCCLSDIGCWPRARAALVLAGEGMCVRDMRTQACASL